jgi:uncharacterized protein YicC (UPF0701 family)
MQHEDQIKRMLSKRIRRGKVDVYISVEGKELYDRDLNVDWRLLSQYVEQLKHAEESYSLSG